MKCKIEELEQKAVGGEQERTKEIKKETMGEGGGRRKGGRWSP